MLTETTVRASDKRAVFLERSGQGMDLMFRQSIRQGKAPPDASASDAHRVLIRLPGEIGDTLPPLPRTDRR